MRRLFLLASLLSALLLTLPSFAARTGPVDKPNIPDGTAAMTSGVSERAAMTDEADEKFSVTEEVTASSVETAWETATDTDHASGAEQQISAIAALTEAPAETEAEPTESEPPQKISEPTNTTSLSRDNAYILTVNGKDGQYTVPLGEYLIGAVMAEMPATFHPEALRAQAIAVRSYLLYRVGHGYRIYDWGSSCTAHFTEEDGRAFFGEHYDGVLKTVSAAVAETDGMVLYYEGDIACAAYHAMSWESTENGVDVWGGDQPYLTSVPTPEDDGIAGMVTTASFDEAALCMALGVEDALPMTVQRTAAGRLSSVTLASGEMIDAERFRSSLRLRSTSVTVTSQNENTLLLTVYGYGHGVGMSQYGADILGDSGYTCGEILAHYYPMTTLGLMP